MDELQECKQKLDEIGMIFKIAYFFGGLFPIFFRPFAEKLWALWYKKSPKNNSPSIEKDRSSIERFL